MAPHKSSGASKRATSHQYSWLLPLGETYWWARATRDPDTWHWVQQHITYWMALQIYRCAHVCVLHPSGQQLNTHWRDPHCGSWDQFWLATCIRSVEGLWGAPNKVDGGYIFVFEHSDLTTRCLFCGLQPVWPLNSDINAFLHAAAASRVFSLSGTVLCKPEGWLRCGENPKVF